MTHSLAASACACGVFHALVVAAALGAAFLLRFEFTLDTRYGRMFVLALPVAIAVKLAVFRGYALRDLPWRYIGLEGVTRMVAANATASLPAVPLLRWQVGFWIPAVDSRTGLPAVSWRSWPERDWRFVCSSTPSGGAGGPSRRILIYGAGRAGVTLLSEIREHPELGYQVAGFLDDNPLKRDLRIRGVRVWGGRAVLAEVVRRERICEILLALPRRRGAEIAAILEQCRSAGVATRRIPPLAELIEDRVLVGQIREVRVEDLLGRPAVQLDESGIRAGLVGKVVLVTGAGGSIGSELCRQMARYHPAAIVGLDQSETALYHIDQEMRERFPRAVFHAEVGSIQNRRRLEEIFGEYRPHAVYHAAAYKHVPLMEAHLFEAIENNVLGTHEVARAARAAA